MGTLGTLGAIVPAVSQKYIAYGMGSILILFEMCHYSNTYFLRFKVVCQFM